MISAVRTSALTAIARALAPSADSKSSRSDPHAVLSDECLLIEVHHFGIIQLPTVADCSQESISCRSGWTWRPMRSLILVFDVGQLLIEGGEARAYHLARLSGSPNLEVDFEVCIEHTSVVQDIVEELFRNVHR